MSETYLLASNFFMIVVVTDREPVQDVVVGLLLLAKPVSTLGQLKKNCEKTQKN